MKHGHHSYIQYYICIVFGNKTNCFRQRSRRALAVESQLGKYRPVEKTEEAAAASNGLQKMRDQSKAFLKQCDYFKKDKKP